MKDNVNVDVWELPSLDDPKKINEVNDFKHNIKITGDLDFDEILNKCCEILSVKGKDYTIGSHDRLANFRRTAEMFNCTKEQVLAIYLYKHVAAIFNYAKSNKQSESEPIEGRIADVINYMLLFYKMIKEDKDKHDCKQRSLLNG